MPEKKQLTVSQLVDFLGKFPADAPVCVEGCDCAGEAIGVVMDKDGDVMVVRNGGVDNWDSGGRKGSAVKAELSGDRVLGRDD